MERTSENEIAKRKKQSFLRSELFAGTVAALIPLFNGFFYWHQGAKNVEVAANRMKLRVIYLLLILILFPLPLISLNLGLVYGEGIGWLSYFGGGYLIAKSHINISLSLGKYDKLDFSSYIKL